MTHKKLLLCFLSLVLTLTSESLLADEADIVGLDLDQLMELNVYSASKKTQKLSDAAAAIFVITEEDIRRSSATAVPELLRMVPGLEVARLNANVWSISSRGFNGRFADKLLVLIDGRTVYTPLFSGVYWNEQELMLENIAKIEVIRGPGASLWGANAVNGVINITTKKASETEGGFISAGGGSEERAITSLRYGHAISEDTSVRVHGKYYKRDASGALEGGDAFDEIDAFTAGFRADSELEGESEFTLQGDVYYGENQNQQVTPIGSAPFSGLAEADEDFAGYNILGRYTSQLEQDSELQFQFFYDRSERDAIQADIEVDTFDAEFQHRTTLLGTTFTWGLRYRHIRDDIRGKSDNAVFGIPAVSFDPRERSYNLVSGFFQNEISLIPNKLQLTIGTKIEHNDFTGVEVQPTARTLYKLDEQQSIWAAFSRAVRTPNRVDDDFLGAVNVFPLPNGAPAAVVFQGERGFESEDLHAFELGYRSKVNNWASVDLATFFFDYTDLRTIGIGRPGIDPSIRPTALVAPSPLSNETQAQTWGAELLLDLKPSHWWKTQLSYTYFGIDAQSPNSALVDATKIENNNSFHRATLRSLMDLGNGFELDAFLRYLDTIQSFSIDSYVELDLRLGFKASENLSFDLIGTNLLEDEHVEFLSTNGPRGTEFQRGVFARANLSF